MQPLKQYFLGQERAAGNAPDQRAEVLPHGRHRRGRAHRPPPHLLRDDGQLLDRRLLQGARRRAGLGARRPRPTGSGSTPTGCGRPSTAATRRCRPTRRRSSCGSRVGVPAGADRAARQRQLLAGRRRSGPCGPVLGAATTTAAPSTAAAGPTARPAATATASSSSGTSCSCSTTCSTTGRSSRCRRPSIDTGGGVERVDDARRRASTACTDTDAFRDLIEVDRGLERRPLRRTRREETKALQGAGRPRPGDDVPRHRRDRAVATRAAATCCAASSAAPSCTAAGSASRARSCPGCTPASSSSWATRYPELVEQREPACRPMLPPRRSASARTLETGGKLLDEVLAGTVGADRRRGRVPAARHLRLPDRADRRDRRRARASGRRGRLRRADGASSATAPGPRPAAAVPRPPGRSRTRPASPPSSSATSGST